MRPYRYVPLEDLEDMRDRLFADIQFNITYGFTDLNWSNRRELRRVGRELGRRAKESK